MRITLAHGLALAAVALALASCGGKQPLKPVAGQKMPAVPVGAAAAPTAQELMTPPMQSRPGRNVELLVQSQERKDDPFDLPPEKQP
jgi:multidrug efflux pump subunit AcrA (membrane-fusion protein)